MLVRMRISSPVAVPTLSPDSLIIDDALPECDVRIGVVDADLATTVADDLATYEAVEA
jgi:hypothetical protein